MNFGEIKKCDIANGEGVRVSLFVSGCTHHCKGCFNAQTWDFNFGEEFTKDVEDSLLEALAPSYIVGLTLLGGEPMEPENQRALMPFLRRVRERFPHKTIWCYSGYTYDKDLAEGGRAWCEVTDEMLSVIDVLVDGPYVEALKDIRLVFKGSSNQRIINLRDTRQKGEIVLYME